MSYTDYFDAVFLINLDSRPDRLETATRRLNNAGIQFQRFPAIRPTDKNGYPTIGHHGAAKSHCAVWEHAIEKGYSKVLIFEDDVLLRDDTPDLMPTIIDQLKRQEWDIFYMGVNLLSTPKRVDANLMTFNFGVHFHAYAMQSGALLRSILSVKSIMLSRGTKPYVDAMIGRQFRKFCATPILAIQEPGKSDTGGPEDRQFEYFKMFDRNDFVEHCKDLQKILGAS